MWSRTGSNCKHRAWLNRVRRRAVGSSGRRLAELRRLRCTVGAPSGHGRGDGIAVLQRSLMYGQLMIDGDLNGARA